MSSNLSDAELDAIRVAYSKAFQNGMKAASAVSAMAMIVAFIAYERGRMTLQEKKKLRYAEEVARRREQVESSTETPAEVSNV